MEESRKVPDQGSERWKSEDWKNGRVKTGKVEEQ